MPAQPEFILLRGESCSGDMINREISFESTDHGMKAGFHDPRFVVPIVMKVVREAEGLTYDQVASAFEYEADGRTIKGLDPVVEFGRDHTLDSLFLLRLPCRDGVREVYLNIEGQVSRNVPYNLRDRAAVYLQGILRRQMEAIRDYKKFRRAYTVWVMPRPIRSRANTWGRIPQEGLHGIQREAEDAITAVGPAEMAFIFLGRADEPVEDRFFRLMNLRFGLGMSSEGRAKALYEEFGIKDDLLVEEMEKMNMWQEAIQEEREDSLKEGREEGREEGLKEGMEMGADIERKAAVEAIAAMVRGFMADLSISPEEAMSRAHVPERYSDSVRAVLMG